MVLRSSITASSSATSGKTASNLRAACGAGAITCTRSAPRKGTHLPPEHAQLPIGGRGKPPSRQLSGLQTREGGDSEKEVAEDIQGYNGRVFSTNLSTPGMFFAEALRSRTEKHQQPSTHQVAVAGPATMELRVPVALPKYEQQTTGQSVLALNVNSLQLDKSLKVVVTAVQQIMKEFVLCWRRLK
jgi:hypothetical protein